MDSFFGFDTSVPLDDDGGGGRIAEPSEEEYDALNDETFGSATNGDWEEAHENLVRLDETPAYPKRVTENFGKDITDNGTGESFNNSHHSIPSSKRSSPQTSNINLQNKFKADSDLELNISSMKLDDVDITFGDNEIESIAGTLDRINMDSVVWANKPSKFHNANSNLFPQYLLKQESNANFEQPSLTQPRPKISTLEDIERNMILQDALNKQQQQRQQEQKLLNEAAVNIQPDKVTPVHFPQQQIFQKQLPNLMPLKVPPGFGAPIQSSPLRTNPNFANNLAQHPLGNLSQQQFQPQASGVHQMITPNNYFTIGLGPNIPTPHPLLPHMVVNQHGPLATNYPLQNQRPIANPHLPTALNNFAMHPNFNVLRNAATNVHPTPLIPPVQQTRLAQHPLHPTNNLLNSPQPNSMFNIFNLRLVEEILQNHPLLQYSNRHQLRSYSNISGTSGVKQQNRRQDGNSSNGNIPDEYDDYANLMSTRDKHWLIGIQLSQLNTDTPYIDDYYYTVYKERKASLCGSLRHSQAHKDNQLNHPLTQPKGHAQLILVQLGNKNGVRNGHRERRNSDNSLASSNNMGNATNSQDGQKQPYLYTPLKFENSLGKLQFGSVTAPRKIIDADVMSTDPNSDTSLHTQQTKSANKLSCSQSISTALKGIGGAGLTTVTEITSTNLRKSRHILLHIETLYHYLLKLEDLENPNALATIILKKKKESERIAALEQLENANKTPEEQAAQPINPALKNKFIYEIEAKDVLINKISTGLSFDKIVAMMNVRKGKVLLRRIMPFIKDHNALWNIWIGIFSSLQNVIKKDRDDTDGLLYAFYPEFKEHIKKANFSTIAKIASSLILNDKKLNGIFCSQFGLRALVCLILRSEEHYVLTTDETLNNENKEKWRQFLAQVASSLNKTIQNQLIAVEMESDSIQPMMNHFERFKNLKLDALFALLTEAKQQIN